MPGDQIVLNDRGIEHGRCHLSLYTTVYVTGKSFLVRYPDLVTVEYEALLPASGFRDPEAVTGSVSAQAPLSLLDRSIQQPKSCPTLST